MARNSASPTLLLVVLTSLLTSHVTQSLCPWEEAGLMKWSDASTWGADGIPTKDKHVDIKAGMAVLLDVSPPALKSMKIDKGGKLVWDNLEGLVLKTGQIELLGDLLIGKDTLDCRMEKKAKIILTGLRDSDVKLPVLVVNQIEYTRKIILVRDGGTLEMHGAEQKSWTKLAATIPSVHTLCATVFDIQNSTYRNTTPGVHVMVWNPDGSVHDFKVFSKDNLASGFSSYMNAIPNGKIVAVAIGDDFTLTDSDKLGAAYSALEQIGAKKIRTVHSGDNYAFIVRKGQKNTAQEDVHLPCLNDDKKLEGPYVNYTDFSRRLQFSARSIASSNDHPGADFKVFNTDVMYPIIKLKDDVSSWKVGDEIVVASSDFDWRQAEVRRVIQCTTCKPDEVRVDGPFEYMHFGQITLGVDERAEVGLLSRSVVVEGEMEDHCYSRNKLEKDLCDKFGEDTFGGHILAEFGTVAHHVQQVELYHLGQQAVLGSYPLHFHLMADSPGQWMRNNSAHRSYQRCYTVHMTDRSEVTDNVCYDHLGHGLFLEDSSEQNNIIKRNLIIGTRYGTTLMSDMKEEWCAPHPKEFCDGVSSFWITHPNNIFEDNVAAGSDNAGYYFVYADFPIGLSAPVHANQSYPNRIERYETRYTPVQRFVNNAAHSNEKYGVIMDARLSTGEKFNGVMAPENAILTESNNYLDPRVPNNKDGKQTNQILEGTTMHHNKLNNMRIRGGNVIIKQSTFADAPVGFYAASSAENTSVEVRDSVFVGETENRGQPFLYTNKSSVYGNGPYPTHLFNRSIANNNPSAPLTAVSFAEGPFMVENCYFDQYRDMYWNDTFQQQWGYRPLRSGGALSFRRKNQQQSVASNGVHKMKFGLCDKKDKTNWVLGRDEIFENPTTDGNIQTQFRDYDGSVTGQAGTQLVRNVPFLTGPTCVYHANWGMSACPYSYAKLLFTGTSGVLKDAAGSKSYPVIMRRDDKHQKPFSLRGDSDIEFLTMTNKSYTVNFNGTFPKKFTIKAMNLERGDTIRLGLCMPKDTYQLALSSSYGKISSEKEMKHVNSIAELDAYGSMKAIYYDPKAYMVFFKLVGQDVRQHWQEKCPGGQCVDLTVERLDGGDAPRDCSQYTFPAFDDHQDDPNPPMMENCCGPDPPVGLGAPLKEVTSPAVLQFNCQPGGGSSGGGGGGGGSGYTPRPPKPSPPSPSINTQPAKAAYLGCYFDSNRQPDFVSRVQNSAMTRQICFDRCRRLKFQYAGLKGGQYCGCGRKKPANRKAWLNYLCSTKCQGNQTETCGGLLTFLAFRITN